MWTELRECRVGDYIKAWFLGDKDPEGECYGWHEIFEIERKSNGKYYVAIEGWRGGEVYGTEDVFVKS